MLDTDIANGIMGADEWEHQNSSKQRVSRCFPRYSEAIRSLQEAEATAQNAESYK